MGDDGGRWGGGGGRGTGQGAGVGAEGTPGRGAGSGAGELDRRVDRLGGAGTECVSADRGSGAGYGDRCRWQKSRGRAVERARRTGPVLDSSTTRLLDSSTPNCRRSGASAREGWGGAGESGGDAAGGAAGRAGCGSARFRPGHRLRGPRRWRDEGDVG